MSIETPQPKRDPEFYDEQGRVKDPNIAHAMAQVENYLHEDKKVALEKSTQFNRYLVEKEFEDRKDILMKWMETAPEAIQKRERALDEYLKEREAAKALLEGPSLLSVEEEQALLDRLGQLKNLKVDKSVLEHLFDGKAHDDVKETDFSIENFASFLESFDQLLSSNPEHSKHGLINLGISTVRCANGKTSIDCWIGAGIVVEHMTE